MATDLGRSPPGRASRPSDQARSGLGDTATIPNAEPVSITVDRIFELLNDALLYAIKNGGGRAKSFAWDARHHFLVEIGHLRTEAIAIEARRAATGNTDAVHESAGRESDIAQPQSGPSHD